MLRRARRCKPDEGGDDARSRVIIPPESFDSGGISGVRDRIELLSLSESVAKPIRIS